jgi:hypothetical protein
MPRHRARIVLAGAVLLFPACERTKAACAERGFAAVRKSVGQIIAESGR